MIELIIQPSKRLSDVMGSKSAEQLIDLIEQSSDCERLSSIAIHLTAMDALMQKYPDRYNDFIHSLNIEYGAASKVG